MTVFANPKLNTRAFEAGDVWLASQKTGNATVILRTIEVAVTLRG